MRIGHFIIDYYVELFVPENKFSLLNKNKIDWCPVLDMDRANAGWVWFSKAKEYRRTKTLLKNKSA